MGTRIRTTLIVAASLLILLLTAGTVMYNITARGLLEAANAHLVSTAQERTRQIEAYLQKKKEMVLLFAGASPLKEGLAAIKRESAPGPEALEKINSVLKSMFKVSENLHELSVADTTGVLVASTNGANAGKHIWEDARFRDAVKGPFISDPFYSTAYGVDVQAISAPVYDGGGEVFVGVVEALLNIDELYAITMDRTGLGRTGEVYLINSYGRTITPTRSESDDLLKKKMETENTRRFLADLEKVRSGILPEKDHVVPWSYPNYSGILVLGTHKYVPGVDWGCLVEIEENEAMEQVGQLKKTFLIAGFIFMAIVIVATEIVLRRRVIGKSGDLEGTGLQAGGGPGSPQEAEGPDISASGPGDMKDENRMRVLEDSRRAALSMLQDADMKRKRAEEALEKFAATEQGVNLLSHAVEQSPVVVLIADTDGKIRYVNPRFEEMTGYSHDEVVGMNPRILNAGEQDPEVYEELWKTISSGKTWHGELCNRKKNGDIFWEEASISPVKDSKGKVISYMAVKQDITDRRRAKEELKMAKEAAESASIAKSDFLASMSHELRTPLNAIIGFSQVLVEPYFGELNDKQAEYVNDILTSGEHLLSLINDILDLSKIEAGGMVLELEEVDVKQLLHDSLVMIKEKAHKHNIALDIKLADELDDLVIIADQRKLKQIIFNLLSNAAKFTPDGESIVLEAHLLDDKLSVSVTDTGIGIAPEEQEHVLDAFYQVGGSTKGKIPGTGLGLSLVKRFVELHGGEVWIESEGLGKGTRVAFTIPVAPPFEKRKGDEDEAEDYDTGEPKILKILGKMNHLIALTGKKKEAFTLCCFYDEERRVRERADEVREALNFEKRKKDTLEIDEYGNCYLILVGVDGKNARYICKRLLKTIETKLGLFDILCATATFPEDGETSESLLEHLMLEEVVAH